MSFLSPDGNPHEHVQSTHPVPHRQMEFQDWGWCKMYPPLHEMKHARSHMHILCVPAGLRWEALG